MRPGACIDYKALRKIDFEAARQVVLEYLKTNGGNISDAAPSIRYQPASRLRYPRKQAESDLRDRSRATPKPHPTEPPPKIKQKVVEAKNRTRLSPKRLLIYLAKYEGSGVICEYSVKALPAYQGIVHKTGPLPYNNIT